MENLSSEVIKNVFDSNIASNNDTSTSQDSSLKTSQETKKETFESVEKQEKLPNKAVGSIQSENEGALNDEEIINIVLANQTSDKSNKDKTEVEGDDSELKTENDEDLKEEIDDEVLETEAETSEISESDLETIKGENEIENINPEVGAVQPNGGDDKKENSDNKDDNKKNEEKQKQEEEKTPKELAIKTAKIFGIITAIVASPAIGGAILMYYLTSKNEEEEKERMEDIKNLARHKDIFNSGKNNQFKYTEEDMNIARESAIKSLSKISNFASKNGLDEKSISGLKEMKNDIVGDKKNEKIAKTKKVFTEKDTEIKEISQKIARKLVDKEDKNIEKIDNKLNGIENEFKLPMNSEVQISRDDALKYIEKNTDPKVLNDEKSNQSEKQESQRTDIQTQGSEIGIDKGKKEEVSDKTQEFETYNLTPLFDDIDIKDTGKEKSPNLNDLFEGVESVVEGDAKVEETRESLKETQKPEEFENGQKPEQPLSDVSKKPDPEPKNAIIVEKKEEKTEVEEINDKQYVNNDQSPIDHKSDIKEKNAKQVLDTKEYKEPEIEQPVEEKIVEVDKFEDTKLSNNLKSLIENVVINTEFDKVMGEKNTEIKTKAITTKIVEKVTTTESQDKGDRSLTTKEKSDRMKAYSKTVEERSNKGKNDIKIDDTVVSNNENKFEKLLKNSHVDEKMREGLNGKWNENKPHSAPVRQQSVGFER